MSVVKLEEKIAPDACPLGRVTEASVEDNIVRREVTVIKSGWGSSGYYSEAMLKRDGPEVFGEGLHMYVDHPTKTEMRERPERSIKDLAAVFRANAEWDSSVGGLVTEADIFPAWQPVLNHDAVARAIGTSIIAYGESEHGEAEGRTGPLITRLTQGLSCDFVTHAGAGGELGSLIEAAAKQASWPIELGEARNAADWLAAYLHTSFTKEADYLFAEGFMTREERIALSGAIGAGLDAFNVFIGENVPQLMSRDPYGDPNTPVATENNPPSGEEDNMDKEIEARLSALEKRAEEAEDRAKKAEERATTAETQIERDQDAKRLARAKEVAEKAIKDDSRFKQLPEKAVERAVGAAYDPAKLPVDSEGGLIEATIRESAINAAVEEKDYLTGTRESGRVRGMGDRIEESGDNDGDASFLDEVGDGEVDEETKQAQESLAGTFQSLGLSEAAAKVAAEGR